MVRLYYSASILAGRASAPYVLPPYIHLCTYTVYTCITRTICLVNSVMNNLSFEWLVYSKLLEQNIYLQL